MQGTLSSAVVLSGAASDPAYDASFTISTGSTSIDGIKAPETPVFASASVNGSSGVATTLGIDGGLASIVTTAGKNLTVQMTNATVDYIDVTVSSVAWSNANSDQKFKKLKNKAGITLYDID